MIRTYYISRDSRLHYFILHYCVDLVNNCKLYCEFCGLKRQLKSSIFHSFKKTNILTKTKDVQGRLAYFTLALKNNLFTCFIFHKLLTSAEKPSDEPFHDIPVIPRRAFDILRASFLFFASSLICIAY